MWTVSSLPTKGTSPGNVKGKNVKRKWSGHVFGYVMYFGIDFVSFYNFSIGFWKCSDSVVFFLFFILFISYIMDKMSVNEAFQE